ncbi:MAG: hypothetical protein U0325_20615 [Polyangiales bacterium]
MRRLVLSLALAGLGCNAAPATPMSYARCTAEATCGIATRCEPVRITSTGAPASLCTAACVADLECPGWAGRCVPGASEDAGAPRCFHGCAVNGDCRPGTVCTALAGRADAGVDGGLGRSACLTTGLRPCACVAATARPSRCGARGSIAVSELRCRP